MNPDTEKGGKNDDGGRQQELDTKVTHPTNYCETLMHLFKGNIGPGLFAMGYAFKNGGIVLSPILTVIIAIICVHCQHILLGCALKIKDYKKIEELPDYADTVEKSFEMGPPNLRRFSKFMRTSVNIFICVTQLGFCCIYFVFISSNLSALLSAYGVSIDKHLVMLFAFSPVLLTSLITKLKLLSPVSIVANICMVFSFFVTLYFTVDDDLPNIQERDYVKAPAHVALFFGTAIFAFEGIALVLPLMTEMKKPHLFNSFCGVLNVGMVIVTFLFIFAGFMGYWKWGEETAGSLTLNLPHWWLADVVKVSVSLGVLFGYPLQFFIAIQIMWPNVYRICRCRHPLVGELFFRTLMVLVTFSIAEIVPSLGDFISLIGALCSTSLALVFPPLIELILRNENSKGPGIIVFIKNTIILLLALLGFTTGTYESIIAIAKDYEKGNF